MAVVYSLGLMVQAVTTICLRIISLLVRTLVHCDELLRFFKTLWLMIP